MVDATAQNRYFDVYTERAGPDVGLELSRSISTLNIVPKKYLKATSKRNHTCERASDGRAVNYSTADLCDRWKDAATSATISHGSRGGNDLVKPEVRSADSSRSLSPQLLGPVRASSLKTLQQAPRSDSPQALPNARERTLPRSIGETDLPYLAGGEEATSATRLKRQHFEPALKSVGRSHSTPSDVGIGLVTADSVSRSSTTPSLSRRTGSRSDSAESTISTPQWTPSDESPICSPQYEFGSSPETEIPASIAEIIGRHASGPLLTSLGMPGSPPTPAIPKHFRSAIPSIDDIVRKNSPSLAVPLRSAVRARSTPTPASVLASSRTMTAGSACSGTGSSVDSIADEVLQSIRAEVAQPSGSLHHTKSQPNLSVPLVPIRTRQSSGESSFLSESAGSQLPLSPLPSLALVEGSGEAIARYLRSPRLTRLLTLRKPPNHHLTVSLADVGDPYGHPVVVYLGLGSVRYLVALYDEIAHSLGLRLICIDRWGLGKTGNVSDSRRGFLEWSTVVEEVLEQLEITRFSILAHSAGAPYALGSCVKLNDRIHGAVHLLAPWVSTAAVSAAGSYKWLRYVPSSVIRTAQVAEWKVQAWKLGKPPSLAVKPVGFNPRAPLSSESAASSPVFATFAEDGEDDDDETNLPTARPVPNLRSISPSSSIASSLDQVVAPRSQRSTAPTRMESLQRRKGSKGLFGGMIGSSKASLAATSGVSPSASSAVSDAGERLPAHRQIGFSSSIGTEAGAIELGAALLRASHAESLRGGTSDLMAILERNNKPPGFAYRDIERPVRVWHGLKDEKISLEGVLGLERTMRDCKVNVIPGADHSLMTNVPVIVQVLNSIAHGWTVVL